MGASRPYWRCNAFFCVFLVALISALPIYYVLTSAHLLTLIHAPYRFSSSLGFTHFKEGISPRYINISLWEGLAPPPNITLQKLFSTLTPTVYPSSFLPLTEANHEDLTNTPGPFTSRFLPNPNNYVSVAVRHACIEPQHGGRLLLVGVNASDIDAGRSKIHNLGYLWDRKYGPCGEKSTYDCAGVRLAQRLPENARWVPGNTLHFIAYSKGNTFHNFAERVWPRLAISVPPLNETTAGLPVHHFFVHKLDRLLEEASSLQDRDQILWQFRMLMEIWRGANLLRVQEGDADVTMCFDTLLLQMHDKDRLDCTHLPPSVYTPALLKYREATFQFLNLTVPIASHDTLRVLYYGRSDSSRRRVRNNEEIISFIQHNITKKIKMEIRSLDLLLQASQTDYTFTQLVSLFSQTDVLIIAHGAFTWGSLFMPRGALVVEIHGPCDFIKPSQKHLDVTKVRSWIWGITDALRITHDTSNPFKDPIANPKRGNTTLCIDPFKGIPDYTIDPHKIGRIIESFYALSPTT